MRGVVVAIAEGEEVREEFGEEATQEEAWLRRIYWLTLNYSLLGPRLEKELMGKFMKEGQWLSSCFAVICMSCLNFILLLS